MQIHMPPLFVPKVSNCVKKTTLVCFSRAPFPQTKAGKGRKCSERVHGGGIAEHNPLGRFVSFQTVQ